MGDRRQEPGEPVDVVIFFDANVPGLKCRDDCENQKSVLCMHRLNFRAHLEYRAGSLNKKNDFQVLEIFFKLIHDHEQEWRNETGEALFILVTRDRDFLTKDAPRDYKAAVKAGTKTQLSFSPDSVSDGQYEIVAVIVREAEDEQKHKRDYDMERNDLLRCMIRKLNELWASRQDS